MTVLTESCLTDGRDPTLSLDNVSGRVHRDLNIGFLLFQYFSVCITVESSVFLCIWVLALVFLLLINVQFITVQLHYLIRS